MSGRSAVVVGGGIGGLAAGLALHRAGWDVEVRERSPEFTEIGAGLSLWPNALRVLDRLGLLAQVRALGQAEGHGGVRDRRGRWLTRTSAAEIERRFGYPLIVVHRADLLGILREALPTGLKPGVEVTAIPDADLVVGADGANSTIRRMLFPGHEARYAGYTAWRMLTPFRPLVEGAVTWGLGERFGFTAMAGGLVYCFATATVPAGGKSSDGEHAELVRRFAGWPDPVPALIAATAPASVLRHDIADLPPLSSYARGRVALLGDAAHAMTPNLGQGACQALEDAVTLAATLSGESDVPAALAAYDRARRHRTQAIVARSARLGRIGQIAWPPAAAARDLVARLTPTRFTLRAMTPVLSWDM